MDLVGNLQVFALQYTIFGDLLVVRSDRQWNLQR
jgi:hypothetical protein